jgi:regulator of PEP synthase PpsR (kinase-PPPase family)
VARAAAAQYASVSPVEHMHPLVRSHKQLDRVLAEIENAPGIVLYTLLDPELTERLEKICNELGLPYLNILRPVLNLFQAYLGGESKPRVGAQHVLNAEYFKRIDALNYTMLHDDGQHVDDMEQADVVLVGVSRTSKTPTSIYLANRGIKAANVPYVPGQPLPDELVRATRPLVVGLTEDPERLVQIRRNRLRLLNQPEITSYVDPEAVRNEVNEARRFYARQGWPVIDVTRRSIEETAAEIIKILARRTAQAETIPSA